MAFYKCQLCNRKYKTSQKLINHLKLIHMMTDDDAITTLEEVKKHLIINGQQVPKEQKISKAPREPVEPNQNRETNRQRKERLLREQQEKDHIAKLNRIKEIEEANERIHKAKLEVLEKEKQTKLEVLEKERLEQERINALIEKAHTTIEERINNKQSPNTSEKLDIDTCNICMDSKIDSVIVDCGHEVACMECMDALYARGLQGNSKFNCPGCRKPVTKYIKKYRL